MDARLSLALRLSRRRSIPISELAAALKLSPRAVARAVEELGRIGFAIESHPLLGLRLAAAPDAVLAEEIAYGQGRVGRRVWCVGEAVSTNDLAWDAAAQGPAESDGLAIFAEHQSGGRGRRGNRWLAPAHSSILCSVVLWTADGPGQGAMLTRAAAVAAARAIEGRCDLAVGIKWPNDLVVEDRKVGGILVEARPALGEVSPLVIGIGLNCTQGPEDFPAPPGRRAGGAASLAMLGVEMDRTLLARGLLAELDRVIAGAADPEGMATVRGEAAARCRTLGRMISLREGDTTWRGEVIDLDPDYGLVLRLPEGGIRRFPAMTTHVVAQ
jgi:BirA family biotin operon repressor/biotin-[acetyl-CoA-carboxylase] ligase